MPRPANPFLAHVSTDHAPTKTSGEPKVFVIPGDALGFDTADVVSFTQATAELGDADEKGDEFGASLTAFRIGGEPAIVVGSPGEDADVGAVWVVEMGPDVATGLTVPVNSTFLRPGDAHLPTLPAPTSMGAKLLAPRAYPTPAWTIP